MSRLFFARYHAISAWPRDTHEQKLEFLFEGTKNDASTEFRGFVYRFLEAQSLLFDGKEFITGHLVKYKRDEVEKIVDEEAGQIVNERIRNRLDSEARFIIDPSNSIVMFVEVPNKIGKGMFLKRFRELFEKNFNDFFVDFHLETIVQRYSFVERVKSFKVVERISIRLTPANPRNPDLWKPIQKMLKDRNLDEYHEVQVSKGEESGIVIDNETESKFYMAEDGYGRSTATGTDENGDKKTISTVNTEQDIHEILPDLDDKPNLILEFVKERLQEIAERTK